MTKLACSAYEAFIFPRCYASSDMDATDLTLTFLRLTGSLRRQRRSYPPCSCRFRYDLAWYQARNIQPHHSGCVGCPPFSNPNSCTGQR